MNVADSPLPSKLENLKSKVTGRSSAIFISKLAALNILFSAAAAPKLWQPERSIPKAPVFNSLGALPHAFQGTLSFLMLASCLWLLFAKSRRGLISGIVILSYATLACLDQVRLIPFFFHSCVLLYLSAVFLDKEAQFQKLLIIMLSGIYFWSGFSKLNLVFAKSSTLFFLSPVFSMGLNDKAVDSLVLSGLFLAHTAPFVEFAIGVGLWFNKLRWLSSLLAIAMHLMILGLLGPLWLDYNPTVWGWNILSIIVLWLIVSRQTFGPLELLKPRSLSFILVFFFFLIIPASDRIDDYFRVKLYAFNNHKTKLYAPGCLELASLSNKERIFCESLPLKPEDASTTFHSWYYKRLGLPSYPAERVSKTVFKEVCKKQPGLAKSLKMTTTKPYPFGAKSKEKRETKEYGCSD